MKNFGLLFFSSILLCSASFAQDYYCHTFLWGGELAFQETNTDLLAVAQEVMSECKTSIGAAEAGECSSNLTCDRVDSEGKFQSAIDPSTIFPK